MAKKNSSGGQPVTEIVRAIVEPFASTLGLSIWDIEFKKEASGFVLRVIIDKDGGVSIDDCEALSRAIDAPLDKADPIDTSYCLEVSSAGLDRPLKRDSDFEKFIGSEIDLHLYKAIEGKKLYTGTLVGFSEEEITIEIDKQARAFRRADISLVRLSVKF